MRSSAKPSRSCVLDPLGLLRRGDEGRHGGRGDLEHARASCAVRRRCPPSRRASRRCGSTASAREVVLGVRCARGRSAVLTGTPASRRRPPRASRPCRAARRAAALSRRAAARPRRPAMAGDLGADLVECSVAGRLDPGHVEPDIAAVARAQRLVVDADIGGEGGPQERVALRQCRRRAARLVPAARSIGAGTGRGAGPSPSRCRRGAGRPAAGPRSRRGRRRSRRLRAAPGRSRRGSRPRPPRRAARSPARTFVTRTRTGAEPAGDRAADRALRKGEGGIGDRRIEHLRLGEGAELEILGGEAALGGDRVEATCRP